MTSFRDAIEAAIPKGLLRHETDGVFVAQAILNMPEMRDAIALLAEREWRRGLAHTKSG